MKMNIENYFTLHNILNTNKIKRNMLNQFLSIEYSKNEKTIKRIQNRKINKTNKNPQINETYETNVFSC